MEIKEYKNIFENEESHFYYVSTHNLVLALIDRYLKRSEGRPLKILDAGCGTGLLAKKLEQFGDVVGVDMHPEAVKFSKNRGVNVKKASVTKLPFAKNFFDILVSIDVIYHKQVRSDTKAISEFFRVLKPGGVLILRVPALKWIRVSHDEYVHTRERYNRQELKKKLASSGFMIKKLSYINSLLLLPLVFRSLFENIHPTARSSNISQLPTILNRVLSFILSFEACVLKILPLPLGIGLIAICSKPYKTDVDKK